jgi:hypothetical protein
MSNAQLRNQAKLTVDCSDAPSPHCPMPPFPTISHHSRRETLVSPVYLWNNRISISTNVVLKKLDPCAEATSARPLGDRLTGCGYSILVHANHTLRFTIHTKVCRGAHLSRGAQNLTISRNINGLNSIKY